MEVQMINFIIWIIFGAVAGWVASILTGKNRKMNGIANVVIGIFGAFIGAGIMSVSGIPVPNPISFMGFVVAVGGAVVLIIAMGLVRR
jgi:uncharacterized membrane protein YeaQ/YmgE (transglycosylase-associated protein family)